MAGELFDSYGRPVVIPVAFDDSSGLTDNFGRPLVVVNAILLSGGNLTGDLNIGANKLKTNAGMLHSEGGSGWSFKNLADTAWQTAYGYSFVTEGGAFASASGNSPLLSAQNVDDKWGSLTAQDNGVGPVEIGRMQGAADPYFRIGRDDTGMALNAVTDVLVIQGGAGTNNEATGFGAGLAFYLGNSASEVEKRGAINFELLTATNGGETSRFRFYCQSIGAPPMVGLAVGAYVTEAPVLSASMSFFMYSNVDPAIQADGVSIGAVDISPGHRTITFATEEVPVAAAAGASDVYVPVRWNGVTYKLLLHT